MSWRDACGVGGGMGVEFAVRWDGRYAHGQKSAVLSRFEDGAWLTAKTLASLNKVIATDREQFMLAQNALLNTTSLRCSVS